VRQMAQPVPLPKDHAPAQIACARVDANRDHPQGLPGVRPGGKVLSIAGDGLGGAGGCLSRPSRRIERRGGTLHQN
jgi:hypothetical protein